MELDKTFRGSSKKSDTKEDAAGFRNHRYFLAVSWSLAAKVIAFGTQVLAIPIALHYCGPREYACYVALSAWSLMPSLLSARLGPRYVTRISAFHQSDSKQEISLCFKKGLRIALCGATLSTILLLLMSGYFGYLEASVVSEYLTVFALLSLINICGGLLQTVESVQTGVHQTHRHYMRAVISSLISWVLLLTYVSNYPSIFALAVTLQFVPLATRILNAQRFLYFNPWMLKRSESKQEDGDKELTSDAIKYTFVAGICGYFGAQGPCLYAMSHANLESIGNSIAIALPMVMQLIGLASLFVLPSIPLIANARACGDHDSLQRFVRRLFLIFGAVGTLATLTGCVAGAYWSGELEITALNGMTVFGGAALFASVMSIEFFLYSYMLSVGKLKTATSIYLLLGFRSCTAMGTTWLVSKYGDTSLTFCWLALSILVFSIGPLVVIRRNEIAEQPIINEQRAIV